MTRRALSPSPSSSWFEATLPRTAKIIASASNLCRVIFDLQARGHVRSPQMTAGSDSHLTKEMGLRLKPADPKSWAAESSTHRSGTPYIEGESSCSHPLQRIGRKDNSNGCTSWSKNLSRLCYRL